LASNLAGIIIELIMKEKNGVYHVTGSSYVSRYNQALKIAQAFGYNSSLIEGVETKDLNQKAIRPKHAKLNLDKIRSVVSTNLLSLDEQLDILRKDFLHKI